MLKSSKIKLDEMKKQKNELKLALKNQDVRLEETIANISDLKIIQVAHKRSLKLKEQEKKEVEVKKQEISNKLAELLAKQRKIEEFIRNIGEALEQLKTSYDRNGEDLSGFNKEMNEIKEKRSEIEITKSSIFTQIQEEIRKSSSLIVKIRSVKSKLELYSMDLDELKKKKKENDAEKRKAETEINSFIEEIDSNSRFSEKKVDLHRKEQLLKSKLIDLDRVRTSLQDCNSKETDLLNEINSRTEFKLKLSSNLESIKTDLNELENNKANALDHELVQLDKSEIQLKRQLENIEKDLNEINKQSKREKCELSHLDEYTLKDYEQLIAQKIQEYHESTKELDLINDQMNTLNEESNKIAELLKEKRLLLTNEF